MTPGGEAEEGEGLTLETLIDLEIALVRAFGWSLRDIDETYIDSLLPFVRRITEEGQDGQRLAYADEVDWL